MAEEIVSSTVAQEAVNHVLLGIKEGYAEKSDAKEHIERMEMAHIKLEAALETSHKWNISSAPLLRWQSKLKRGKSTFEIQIFQMTSDGEKPKTKVVVSKSYKTS